ncbi:MAG: hypothetical protein AAGG75_00420 [Bacteroidota bacterium]
MKLITLLTFIGCYILPLSAGSLTHENNPGNVESDVEKPVVVCNQGLVLELMEVTATVVLTAEGLEAGSSDNQTAYSKLKFSFSEETNDNKRVFDCNDLGKKRIKLWVTDQMGNQNYSEAIVWIKDPKKVCGMSLRSSTMARLN